VIGRSTWVVDPDMEARRVARATTELRSGRICVRTRATDASSLMTQTQDLLVALEKDLSVPGSFRNEQVRWIMAHGWLIGDRVSDLYVIDADVLHRRQRERYMSLATTTGTRVWFIARSEPMTVDARNQLSNWAGRTVPASEFLGPLPAASAKPNDRKLVGLQTNFTLPEDDFYVFRAVCRREFDADAFAVLDAWWQSGFTAVLDWNLAVPDVAAAVATHVRATLNIPMEPGQPLVMTRGMQAGLFLRGLLMRVELGRFLSEMTPEAAGVPTERGIGQLRRFVHPGYSTAALIVWVADASVDEIARMTVSDVAVDGSEVRLRGRSYAVPPGAQGIIRAYLAARGFSPDSDQEALFIHSRRLQEADEPVGVRVLARWVSTVAHETGMPFLRRDPRLSGRTDGQWISRRGMSVFEL
jgi:hypothetical protein